LRTYKSTVTKPVLFSEVFNFECPKVNESAAATHPRYADPDDCQYFYVCINGDTPRRSGCKLGQVFDDVQKKCDWVRNVPEWWVVVLSSSIRDLGIFQCRLVQGALD
jgi:hypothetical protein